MKAQHREGRVGQDQSDYDSGLVSTVSSKRKTLFER